MQDAGLCITYIYDTHEAYSPLARIDHLRDDSQGDICWFSTDLNGAPLDVTDEQGNLCWSGQYGSFGEMRYQSDGLSRPTTLHHLLLTLSPLTTALPSAI
ncbi:RHS domain-containing protein [Enterobacter sp. DE0047]|uniref:RHS domain-containing protein n=1 Tax=Enterobacter sp. DE0047 TaxID=2584949 RepID=UPI00336BDC17